MILGPVQGPGHPSPSAGPAVADRTPMVLPSDLETRSYQDDASPVPENFPAPGTSRPLRWWRIPLTIGLGILAGIVAAKGLLSGELRWPDCIRPCGMRVGLCELLSMVALAGWAWRRVKTYWQLRNVDRLRSRLAAASLPLAGVSADELWRWNDPHADRGLRSVRAQATGDLRGESLCIREGHCH